MQLITSSKGTLARYNHQLRINSFDISRYNDIQALSLQFNNALTEFSKAIDARLDKLIIQDRALVVASRFSTLIQRRNDFRKAISNDYHRNDNELTNSEKIEVQLLVGGLSLLEIFLENLELFDVEKKLTSNLYMEIENLYKVSVKYLLNDDFWYNLKLYEYLNHMKIINDSYNNFIARLDPEDIYLFGQDNHKIILQHLYDRSDIYNPLNSQKHSLVFELNQILVKACTKHQLV